MSFKSFKCLLSQSSYSEKALLQIWKLYNPGAKTEKASASNRNLKTYLASGKIP